MPPNEQKSYINQMLVEDQCGFSPENLDVALKLLESKKPNYFWKGAFTTFLLSTNEYMRLNNMKYTIASDAMHIERIPGYNIQLLTNGKFYELEDHNYYVQIQTYGEAGLIISNPKYLPKSMKKLKNLISTIENNNHDSEETMDAIPKIKNYLKGIYFALDLIDIIDFYFFQNFQAAENPARSAIVGHPEMTPRKAISLFNYHRFILKNYHNWPELKIYKMVPEDIYDLKDFLYMKPSKLINFFNKNPFTNGFHDYTWRINKGELNSVLTKKNPTNNANLYKSGIEEARKIEIKYDPQIQKSKLIKTIKIIEFISKYGNVEVN